MILTNSGVLKLMQRIKSYIASQLNTKAPSVHTHTLSEIDDLSSLQMGGGGYTKSEVDTLLNGKSDTSHTHTTSDITDFPTLATVATSGSYNDLTNKPATMTPTSHTHGNITNDGKIGSNANKPLITTTGGTVTTGSFGTSANTFCEGNDSRLSDARTPTAHTHTVSDVTDFPSLSTVATSGSYNDLSNKPTIPTVNNATLTIQKNGTDVKTFTANASSDVTCNITVPTKVSELTNDSGYITSSGSCNYANSAGSSSIATRDSGGSWISGRDNAVVKQTRHSTEDGSSWNPAVSVKTKSGNWTIGTVGFDKLQFSYDTDEDYNTGNNRNTVVELNPESGTIITSANIGSQSVNYANSSGNADTLDGSHAWQMQTLTSSGGVHGSNEWLMQCQYNVDGDGYFKLYCGDKSIGTKVDRANSAGYADSAGGVAWGNVSGRPTIPTNTNQLTNGAGYITSAVSASSYGDRVNYCSLYGSLLIQFGSSVFSSQSGSITFTKAFSSMPVVVVNYGDDCDYSTPCCVDEYNKTRFIVKQYTNGGTWRVNWIAIGKA